MPNWDDLRIFLAAARAGNFSGAARQLGVDISTVSRHVMDLERALNAPLFERGPQGLHITPRGQALIARVESMESEVLALGEDLGGGANVPSATVRIGTMEGIASFYLAGQFVALRRDHPEMRIELVTSSQFVRVNQREADLFLSFFPNEGRGLDVTPVGSFLLHLYASPSYLQSRGTPAREEDLAQHDFVSYIDDLIQLDTVRWLAEAVPHPRVVFHSSSMISQMFSAISGGGIVMLPTFMQAERFGLVRVLENDIWLSRTVWMTVHRDLQYMPRIKVVTQFLKRILKRDYPVPAGIRPG